MYNHYKHGHLSDAAKAIIRNQGIKSELSEGTGSSDDKKIVKSIFFQDLNSEIRRVERWILNPSRWNNFGEAEAREIKQKQKMLREGLMELFDLADSDGLEKELLNDIQQHRFFYEEVSDGNQFGILIEELVNLLKAYQVKFLEKDS